MKGINKTGFPQKIIEKGVPRIIPSDGNEYTIDDDTYMQYKEFFTVTKMPVPPEIRAKQAAKQAEQDRLKDRRNKPLHGVHVKPELIAKAIFMESLYKERRKYGKQNKWNWHLESPNGVKHENVNIKEWCKEKNWVLNVMYKFARNKKPYRGWKITRTNK